MKRYWLAASHAWTCVYCWCFLTIKENKQNSVTADHVIPRAHGGTRGGGNVVPACWHCNQLKGAMTVAQFVEAYPDPGAIPWPAPKARSAKKKRPRRSFKQAGSAMPEELRE